MLVSLCITNWKTHNDKRKDVQTNSWFKLKNTIFDSPSISVLTNTQFVIWIYLLSCRAKSKTENIDVSIRHACFYCKCTEEEFREALSLLQSLDMIKINDNASRGRNVDVTWTLQQIKELDLELDLEERKRESEGDSKPSSADADPHSEKIKPNDLVNAWNENCGNLPKVIKLGSSRAPNAKARLKENPSLEYWVEIIKRLVASDFCNGNNSRRWFADFDFLIKPDTQFKVLEGKYDNKTQPKKNQIKMLTGDEY